MNNHELRLSGYSIYLLLIPALFFQVKSNAAICTIGGDGSVHCGLIGSGKSVHMKRTFTPPGKKDRTIGAYGPNNGFSQGSAPVITYADLNYAYSPQNNLIFYSQNNGSVSMDIGVVNKVTAQQWVMPACAWDAIDSAVGVPVSQTPFAQYFPTATHCKLYEYLDFGDIYSYFEYYDLNPSGVTLLGSADDFESTPNIAASDLYIAPLDIDINFHFIANDTIKYGTQTKVLNEIIDAEGFGTLATPWGTFEVIKIVNHYNEYYYNNGILMDEFHQPVVTFMSKTGSSFEMTLPEGSATTGLVSTEYVEFTRIVYDSFASVQNVTLNNDSTRCDDAFGTLTVAGSGTVYIADSGTTATMVSGHNIKYLAGTKVKPGAKMRGYISTSNQYCPINYIYNNPWNRDPGSGNASEITELEDGKNVNIRVFPNPTNGIVTIRLPENEETTLVKLEIMNINGLLEISKDLSGLRNYTFSIVSLPPGIHFLRVTNVESAETIKLVRN